MKNVSISLTDQHAAEIDRLIESGDYASVSEVVRTALRDFLHPSPARPSLAQIDRDIAAFDAARTRGERMYTLDEVSAMLDADLRT